MKRWYVVQVFAGYEDRIKADLTKSIEELDLGHLFGQVLIPSTQIKQMFDSAGAVQSQQLFPGYMLIEMEAVPEAIRLVSATPRVTRFLGGKEPVPLASREIERILAQMKGEVTLSAQGHQFETGKEVEIKDGPFAGFMGIIGEIDEEGEKLKVMVSIFGRMTPVELGFDKVKQ
jgi:transcription termination/antitermination factor NusG